VAGQTYEYTQMYPGMAKTARTEGFTELAEWFETLAKAEKSHGGRGCGEGLGTTRPSCAGPRRLGSTRTRDVRRRGAGTGPETLPASPPAASQCDR
jgi:hypothetical protein